jgi:hypothetical protein
MFNTAPTFGGRAGEASAFTSPQMLPLVLRK